MRLDKKAYNVIYRIRKRNEVPRIVTKERTIYLPYGTNIEDMNKPLQRLFQTFGFIVQYIID